jgi:hypothetical protein
MCNPSYVGGWEVEEGRLWSKADLRKKPEISCEKIAFKAKNTGSIACVVQCFLIRQKTLSTNTSTTTKKLW